MLLTAFNHFKIEPLNNVFLEIPGFKLFGFDIGPIYIMWYAIFILTGVVAALILGIIEGKKIGIPRDFLEDLVLFGVPISVVGARIYYVIFEWNQYKDNPISIIKINEGGLAIHGAVIAALIWGYYLCKKRGISFLRAVDLGAVGFLVAQSIGRWGNFMNQEAHGGLVPGATLDAQRAYLEGIGLPDFIVNQMYIDFTGYYHPTFLYESLWNFLGLIFMILLRRTKLLYIGDLGLIYLMWYSFGRAIIETMRTDSLYLWNTDIRVAVLLSVVLFTIGATVLILRHVKKWNPKYYFEVIEENK